MEFGVIGFDYDLVPSARREALAALCKQLASAHSVVLSTCHRVEIYFSHHRLLIYAYQLRQKLLPFWPYATLLVGKAAFAHIAYVISGVDSLLFGESDIQRQVKIAYEEARQQRNLPSTLHFAFQKGLKLGKDVRTTFGLPRRGMSYSHLVDALADKKAISTLLFIGNSTVNRPILSFFLQKKEIRIRLCTRSKFIHCPCPVWSWNQIHQWIHFDMVIIASNSPGHLLCEEDLKRVYKKGLIVDLSMPSHVDPQLKAHPLLSVYDLDDLSISMRHKSGEFVKLKQACQQQIDENIKRLMESLQRRGERYETVGV